MAIMNGERGVIYVGHIPLGIFEPQLKKYFSQFGPITRLKLCRSKRDGHSKGYAFIEFDCKNVAAIAAETMNNYILFKRTLKCHVVEPSKVHPKLFSRTHKIFKYLPRYQMMINKRNTCTDYLSLVSRRQKKINTLMNKLKEFNVPYEVELVS
ncbi:RNA recognition motif family protein [Cryptosporidium serpentis]